jgi:hypothetical protein
MKQSVTVHIIARVATKWCPDQLCPVSDVEFLAWPYDNCKGAECVATAVIEVEVPDHLKASDIQLRALRKEQTRLQAEFTARITEIQAQINNLTAIEG